MAVGKHVARCRALILLGAVMGLVAFHGTTDATSFTVPARRGVLLGGLLAGLAPATPSGAEDNLVVTFKVDLGDGESDEVKVKLHPEWAPRGVRRFKQLVNIGEFDNSAIFHVNERTATFGLPAEPTLRPVAIKDDLVRTSNSRGTLSFVQRGQDSRVNELFFNRDDNHVLDRRGLAPIGEVIEGDMEVVDKFFSGYGSRPDRNAVLLEGNSYLDKKFPKLSKIRSVEISS